MLRLPGPDEAVPPLVAPARAERATEEIEEVYEDEHEAEEIAATRSDRNFIVLLAGAAIALTGLIAWWMMPDGKTQPPVAGSPPPESSDPAEPVAPPKPLILEIESTVKEFLEAPTRDEALEWVIDPAGTVPKWDAWLAGEPYAAPGFQGVVGDAIAAGTSGNPVSVVQVRTGDYLLREIALKKVDGRLKIDWDSWAGWSEMTWEAFLAEKPAEPKLFRVVLSSVDYYNFGFRDDREWSSYRLDSPDGMSSIYGYVPRTGLLDQRLRPLGTGAKSKWLLKLKYPADPESGNQVLIDGIVAEGWVDESLKQ